MQGQCAGGEDERRRFSLHAESPAACSLDPVGERASATPATALCPRPARRTRHAIACAEPQRAHMAPACARGSGNHCAIRGCWRARPSCRRVGDEMRRVVVNGGALARGDDAAGCLGRGVRAAGQGSARRRRHRRRRGVRATPAARARMCHLRARPLSLSGDRPVPRSCH